MLKWGADHGAEEVGSVSHTVLALSTGTGNLDKVHDAESKEGSGGLTPLAATPRLASSQAGYSSMKPRVGLFDPRMGVSRYCAPPDRTGRATWAASTQPIDTRFGSARNRSRARLLKVH